MIIVAVSTGCARDELIRLVAFSCVLTMDL